MVTLPGLPIVQDVGMGGYIYHLVQRETPDELLRKSQGYTVGQIVMNMCMLNTILYWGTVHWQYISGGLINYYLAGEQSTVSYVSRGIVIACIYILLLMLYIFCYFVTASTF